MNVEEALTTANFAGHARETSEPRVLLAACVLAAEVDRLRGELLKANADTERLEARCSFCADCDDVDSDGTLNHCGWCPYQLALDTVERQHVVIAELRVELHDAASAYRDELNHVTDAYHAELETVHELNEHLDDLQSQLAEHEARDRMWENMWEAARQMLERQMADRAVADTFPELQRQIGRHPSQRRSGP